MFKRNKKKRQKRYIAMVLSNHLYDNFEMKGSYWFEFKHLFMIYMFFSLYYRSVEFCEVLQTSILIGVPFISDLN